MTDQELTGEIKRLGRSFKHGLISENTFAAEVLIKARPHPNAEIPLTEKNNHGNQVHAEYHSDLTKDPFIAAQIVDNPGSRVPGTPLHQLVKPPAPFTSPKTALPGGNTTHGPRLDRPRPQRQAASEPSYSTRTSWTPWPTP